MNQHRTKDDGFTLLEVMVALAILAVSLTLLAESQQQSMRVTNRSKLMTVATMLARDKMVDIEDQLFEDGFSDFDQKEEGDFKEEGFERFKYELKIDKIEMPTQMNADSLASMLGNTGDAVDDKSISGMPTSGMMSAGAQMMASQFEIFRNVLEQSIRRAHLKVLWKEGSKEKSISVVAYFTDPRKVDTALMGGVPADQIPSTSGTTSGQSPSTTSPSSTIGDFGRRMMGGGR